jgi:hypothetical protein
MTARTGTVAGSRWITLRCPLARHPHRADAFLTRIVGPLMSELVATDEVDDWYFERCPVHGVDIHALTGASAVLRARLTGLAAAVLRPPAAVDIRGRETVAGCADVAGAAPVPHRAQLRHRASQLALEVIAAAPTRESRLRAGLDLSIAASVGVGFGPVTALRWLAEAATDGPDSRAPALSTPDIPAVTGEVTGAVAGAVAAPRWRDVRDAVRAGHGPVARWVGCLRAAGDAGADRVLALHQMHNQLGLSLDDERRIFGTMARALLSPDAAVAASPAAARVGRPLSRLRTPGGLVRCQPPA